MNKSGYLSIRGHQIYYERINPDLFLTHKTPIVFLHEGLGSITQWHKFPKQLCDACNLPGIVYDRFGYGKSDEWPEMISVDFLLDEARFALPQLLDQLVPDKKAFLFGHSDGATISLAAAAFYPERIKALVSEAPHVLLEDISIQGIKDTVKAFKNGWLQNSLLKHHGNRAEKLVSIWTQRWLSPQGKAWSMVHLLPQINCPLLFIQGEGDHFGSLKQWELIRKNSSGNKELLLLEKTGHHPHLERKNLVIEHCTEFFLRNNS
jgi:pimeloyl-ACP methyl ester carboxylesterase